MAKPRGSVWRHRKHWDKKFIGSYTRYEGERNFVLRGEKRKITFESWQAAKLLGWVKS